MSACNVGEIRNDSQNTVSGDWNSRSRSSRSPTTTRSSSPNRGETIFDKYLDIIHSKSNLSVNDKSEPTERPFDFFDDEEFAFGINLLNNNVACVGDNITKLIQMGKVSNIIFITSIYTSSGHNTTYLVLGGRLVAMRLLALPALERLLSASYSRRFFLSHR